MVADIAHSTDISLRVLVAAGQQATIAAWDPSLGGVKPAPWPYHSWPETQGAAGYKANMQALNDQIAANTQLVAAYGTC